MSESDLTGIAIVGMAGRFPRARTVDEFWRNLRDGVDCISYFRDDELEAANPEDLKDPSFVKARGVLEDEELFDARFFEVPPLQAELMDPQHRFFLECAAHALEDAGYDPERVAGTVGVFGGVTLSSYFLNNLLSNPDLLRKVGSYQVVIGTDRDYLTTLASYKLNLKGPSLNVQTACSTSLVATVLACQSLLSYTCDMALAGGVSIKVPQRSGYFYQPGGLDSSDGRCRAFDAKADGSVYGSAVGVVVLKRLEDAIADGDAIHGVLVGAAMNNDGSAKVGFTAPGVDGQADVIATAQALAGVDPATIGFVECHGTGTALGDPIEVAALTKAFRAGNPDLPKNYCALGAVKTNIGHCAAAAGVSGLIKGVLAVKNRQIPPNLHFERPNPAIDFANSPFYVSDRLREWETDGAPRRAGVSSFGLGGTNAHVVVQEAPEPAPSGPSRPWQILVLSAKSEASLEAATGNLAADLEANPGRPLADVAYTLQMGRRAFPLRRVLVCQETAEAAKALGERDPRRLLSGFAEPGERPVAFLFPGVGDHYPGMARGLYESEPVFREHLDRCAELLSARLGGDLREIILPKEAAAPATGGGMDLRKLLGRGGAPAVESEASRQLNRTLYAQPAVFAIEYALGKLWLSWGLRPEAMLGYSLGEYSAACLAGVLTLEDATLLVAERARLIEGLPAGAMLAVPLPEERVKSLLSGSLDLSAVNAPAVCVVSGPVAEIEAFQNRLGADGVTCRRLPTTHAFHSRMMEPIVPALTELARRVQPRSPEIPVLSNVTGTWMTPAEAADPTYWVRHLCQPVRFAAGVAALWSNPSRVLLEVGPGFGLSTLALQQAAGGDGEERLALPTLRNQHDRRPDQAFLLDALGKLWLAGVRIDWSGFMAGESRRRVRLPLYAFDRQRYWVEPRGGLGLLPRQDATEIPSEAAGQEADAAARRARHARPNLRTAYVEPSTETEKRIAGIYRELLGLEKVGAHDSFFELGGHSLLGTQVISRLGRDLGADVPLSRLFELPTPADLAQEVDSLTRTSSRVPPIQPVPRESGTYLPLSFAQQRLWFLQRFDLASPAYNLPLALRLSGPADLGALAGAVHEVLRRHEALRTRFPEIQGEPAQVIDAPRLQALPLADLSGLPEAIREAEARRLAVAEARRPFDLAADPLLRVAVLRLGAQEHLLLATQHHIVSDGWSMGVLVREVAALYPALLEGRPSPFPDLPVQYADYAVWQRERLSGERLDAELAWWRERLGGAPVHLELPADRPRSLSESARAGRVSAVIPAELWQRLTAIAQGAGATAFMTLMTGFQALLGRYTQLDDFLVGTPLANRIRPEIEGLIGFFVNTLVLRADLAGGPSFLAHLARVRESSLAAADHQELPFEQVVEALRPERAPGENPLFQVMMVLQNAPIEAFELPGLTLRGEPVTSGAAKLDLAVQFYETPDGVAGVWEYRTDLFDESTIERAARHFANLLAAAAGEPERAVAELPLLDEGERGQLLAWSGSESRTESRFVHELIAARAAEIPDQPALVFTGGSWTYAELERRSNLLARRLRDEMGVGPERIVAVGTERTPETVAALLAILKAGGAYLPLDPAYPAERLRYIWEDAGRPPILAPARLLSALPEEIREGWIPLEVPLETPDGADPGAPPAAGLTPDSLAYVIYTSGSTGRPKGTLLVHRGFANVAMDMARHFHMEKGGRVLQFASFSFDASIMDVFSPLIAGAEIHLAAPEELIPGPDLIHLIQQRGITTAILSPSILMASPLEEMPALHTLAVGGEACPPELIGIWGEGRRFLNGYGPTEATVCSTIAEPAPSGVRPPIGRPIANVRAYVLDRRFGMVPAGVPGELCLGGVGVARGYLGRPDLTADRFRPDPFGEEGARLYRSGDLVRWLPSGELDFLGRIDQQVKIRGFRIETGEIESVLARNPAVRAAVVEARPDGGTHRLVAYVVPSNGEVNVSELRGFLRGELPDYMIPAAWVTLDALPINASGKVDRRALPAPGLDRPDLAAGYLAPRDAVEEGLAAIWGRLLGVERVGVRDNFFELGGHSLLAHRVQTAVRESFGVEIELRAIFERPTVEELAVTIAQARGASADEGELAGMLESLEGLSDEEVEALLAAEDEAEEPAVTDLSSRIAGLSPKKRELLLRQLAKKQGGEAPQTAARIERRPRTGGEERFPVSFSQLREWILDRIEPGNPAYNVPGASRATGTLSVTALRGAVQEIVRRHESLRTTFVAEGAEPLQVVAPSLEIPVPLIDLSALSPELRETEGHRLAKAAIRESFDLARGPLLRVRLIRLSAREHLIPFILHHIISDGWSMGVFSRELSVFYAAIEAGRPSPLPELPIQYGDFAAWQREWLQGETLERHLDYWRRQLAGAPPLLTLPTDRPRPPVQTFRGGKLAWQLAREESAGLKALAQESGTSLFVTLLSAFQAVLSRWSGQEDICVGTFSGNRNRSEVEGLIGFFINTLVLRGDLGGDPTFRELVKRLRETALEAYSHGEIPFEKLLDALRLERDLSHTPLFQAMLVLQNFPAAEMQPSEVVLSPLPLQDDRADFDLSLWLAESDGQVGGYFEYNTDLFDEATMRRLGEHLRNLIRQAGARPDVRLLDLELWGSEERGRVLEAWSRVEEAEPVPPVHRAFEAQAERTPDAVALASEEGALTYRELNERAEALAAHLRDMGAGPERIVGVCLDRSFELIVALLAVVKSGAAYLPLDPDYPADRLAYMLEDSGAAALITRKDFQTDLPRVSPDAVGTAPSGPDPDPDHPVYVIYTSGSTGRPKGVLVRHGSLAQYAETARRAYGIGPGDRVLQFASISFDTSAEEIYPCLTGGATLVLRTQSKPQDAAEFLAHAGRLGVTVLDLPTAYWHELVSALERDPALEVPPAVRLVILGGERALPSRVRSWRERVGERVRLVNTYGPTESTIVATHADLSPGPWQPHWDAEVPIGQPIRGARAYVLDRRLRPVPQGIQGELCVGGTGVARGYLGRPDLTAERFVPDAFSQQPGARLYRTGDLVRFRPDGRLEFGGRVDQQVKIRGVRIEPGEVETALVTHPAVAEAVVAARPDVTDGHRLIAWVVPRSNQEPTIGEMREFLRERLPEGMVPSAFVTVPALPRLPNGKVDRRALPDPSGERANLGTAYAAPETELERTIAGVWQELLRVGTVGLHDNFFDLGGHSLLLVQAQGRLREALGRDIPVVDLFRFPTVSLLARHLGEDSAAATAAAAKKVQDLGGKQRSAMDRQRQAMAKAMQSRLKKDQ